MGDNRRWLVGLAAILGSGCVGLGGLADGDDGVAPCPAGQQRIDGQCVEAPAPQPAKPDGACAEGLQDNDNDKVCEASCASAKLACSPHSRCDDASGKASCLCATGYVREGEVCAWRGGPRDPGFANDPPAAWEVKGGALEPAATAPVDKGRVRFTDKNACGLGSYVRQTFPMPAFADAEPFALDISGQASGLPFERNSIAVYLGGGFGADALFEKTPTVRVCLGERAYGRDVELRIRANATYCLATNTTVDVDRAVIVPEPACAPIAKVQNGDFEGTGGWVVSGTGAEVAIGVGTGGGRGGHVFTTNLCQSPSLRGAMSAPFQSMAKPALSFSVKGTNGKKMLVEAGPGATLGDVTGTATFQAVRLCVPEWAKGVVQPLYFRLDDPGGTCADPNVRDFVFDDVAFVSEASCPEKSFVVDGGFESATSEISAWRFEQTTPFSTGAKVARGAGAHSGSAYATLSTAQVCHRGTVRQTITVPESVPGAGPAVTFWYRLPTAVKGSFSTVPGGSLAVSAGWTKKTVCLDPRLAGRPTAFEAIASGGAGTCADTFATERLDIDDVEVTTDATCPIE